MAAQPTPPQTPTTTPSPTLTAAQARALLHTLLSTISNPPASRTSSNTTTTPSTASRTASPPSKTSIPSSSQQTLTIDASTRIMGHANKIHLPPNTLVHATRIEEILRAALSQTTSTNGNMKPTSHQSTRPVNITIQTGINLMGSRNVVVFGAGSGSDDAVKDAVKARGGVETVGGEGVGRKRRAESEPVEVRGKKVKVEREF